MTRNEQLFWCLFGIALGSGGFILGRMTAREMAPPLPPGVTSYRDEPGGIWTMTDDGGVVFLR